MWHPLRLAEDFATLPPEVPYRGYALKELTLVPRPVRRPVELHRVVVAWQEAHARIGQHLELGERLCFGFHFYLAPTREQGIREAGKYYEENLKMFGPLRLVRALSDEQIEAMSDPSRAPHANLPKVEDAIAAGGFLCGSPAQLVEHLKALEERYPGLDRISVSLSVGVPKAVALEQLEWFASEVMPAFKRTPVAAAV
jgi:alkanesulfonate monooxygenase SsuD/methylene tetrahydromethanopterin reductase-like flavin-dependent oxidoreductase (luciferase family)